MFLINGFRGTSVKQITEAAGISRGGLYRYFRSKEESHIAVIQKFETEMLDMLREKVGGSTGNFTARFRLFNKYSTEFARDNRELSLAYNTLLSEKSFTNTEVEKVAKSVHTKFHLIVKEMLDQWLIVGESMDVRCLC